MPAQPADSDDDDVALVLQGYALLGQGDVDGAVADLHPDIEWIEPDEFPNGGAHHGRAAVAEYLRRGRAQWAEIDSTVTPYRLGADIAILHEVTGRLIDGTPRAVTVADVFTVRDGQVVRMRAYADPAEVLGDAVVRTPFDAIGARYEEAFTDRAAELAATEWLISGVTPGARVLDLGCGTGLPVAKRLTEAGFAVTGIDESSVMLDLARERVPAATFLRADMRSIGPELGEFEAAAAFFSLLMLPKADIEAVLRALRDRLCGPGLLALAMVAGDFDAAALEFLDVPVRLSAYPADALAKLVASTGFDVVDVQEIASIIDADHTETQIYLRARSGS